MKAGWAALMLTFRPALVTPLLIFLLASSDAEAQDAAIHGVVPLRF